MSDSTVYLITGANRGIGLEVLKLYASDARNILIAGVRDPAGATEVNTLAKSSPAAIHVVKIVAGDEEGNQAAAAEVAAKVGRVDVLWANAGISDVYKPVLQTTVADFESHWRVNVLGPVVLFQAFYPLLLKSTKTEKKFVITSTAAGSIGIAGSLPFPVSAYGSSKAAINFVAAKIHQEHGDKDKLVVIPIHPGMVSTDMGQHALKSMGVTDGVAIPGVEVITPVESATGLKNVIDNATFVANGGKFVDYAGKDLPW